MIIVRERRRKKKGGDYSTQRAFSWRRVRASGRTGEDRAWVEGKDYEIIIG